MSTIILLAAIVVAGLINNKYLHYILTPLILMRILYMFSWALYTVPVWLYTTYQINPFVFGTGLVIFFLIGYFMLNVSLAKLSILINKDHRKVAKISLIISYSFALIYCIAFILLNLDMHLIAWVCCITSFISYFNNIIGVSGLSE